MIHLTVFIVTFLILVLLFADAFDRNGDEAYNGGYCPYCGNPLMKTGENAGTETYHCTHCDYGFVKMKKEAWKYILIISVIILVILAIL